MTGPSTSVRIENLADIEKLHKCTSQEILTQIRIEITETKGNITNLSAMLQEIRAQWEEHIGDQDMCLKEQMKIIKQLQEEIIGIRMWIEKEESRKKTNEPWVNRILNVAQGVVITILGLFILFFIKGGSLQL